MFYKQAGVGIAVSVTNGRDDLITNKLPAPLQKCIGLHRRVGGE